MEEEVANLKERLAALEGLVETLANAISRYGIAFPGLGDGELKEDTIMERLDDIESRLDEIAPEETS